MPTPIIEDLVKALARREETAGVSRCGRKARTAAGRRDHSEIVEAAVRADLGRAAYVVLVRPRLVS